MTHSETTAPALEPEDDDFGQPYTLWEKFLTHTDASTWPATYQPARTAP